MTIRPIDIQVVLGQQTNVAGTEQSNQNMASQIQTQAMQKIPEKKHERETQVENTAETDSVKIQERESDKRKRARQEKKGSKGRKGQDRMETLDAAGEPHIREDGKGVRFDALS